MSFRTPGERTLNAIRGRVAAGYRAAQSLVRRSLTLSVVSSRDVVRTVVTVRCYSLRLATVRFIGPRGDTHAAGWNLFGLVKATRSLLGALVQACKQSSCRLCVSFHVLSLFIHADEPKRRTVENARIESGEIRNVMR